MRYIIVKSFICGIFLFLATTTFALSRDKGTYLEGNVGISVLQFRLFGIITISGFNGAGANANLGYQLNRYFASEMGFTYITGARYADAAMKAILPFQIKENDFTVFGKLGAAYVYDNDNHNYEVTPYIGLGASYAISPSLDINIQGQGVTASIINLALLSLGLTYHFN
jgi:Outer membrane protein beta-barrel domain